MKSQWVKWCNHQTIAKRGGTIKSLSQQCFWQNQTTFTCVKSRSKPGFSADTCFWWFLSRLKYWANTQLLPSTAVLLCCTATFRLPTPHLISPFATYHLQRKVPSQKRQDSISWWLIIQWAGLFPAALFPFEFWGRLKQVITASTPLNNSRFTPWSCLPPVLEVVTSTCKNIDGEASLHTHFMM